MQIRMMIACIREIQIPITELLGLTDVIPLMKENSSLYEYAKTINTFGILLADMIENTRLYYQLRSGAYECVPSDFILLSELRIMWQNLIIKVSQNTQKRFLVRRTGSVKCSLSISDNVPNAIVATDTICLRKVFFAVIHNAIRFTQEGEIKVTVSASNVSKSQCVLHIMVADTGVGVPDNFRDIIFEPLTKAHVDTVEGGTGMSLAVARLLCRQLGGDVVLMDKLTGGSTFHAFITLKCKSVVSMVGSQWYEETIFHVDELPVTQLPPVTSQVDKVDTSHMKMPNILVVEDMALCREILKHSLHRVHIQADMSSDGQDAVHKCGNTKYDIIFMDIYMPKMNGIDTCKQIKQSCPLNFDTPIIALSGIIRTDTIKSCITAGMVEVIGKPIDHNVLIQTIFNTLEKPEQRQWLATYDVYPSSSSSSLPSTSCSS